MSRRSRIALVLVAVAGALVLPAAAWAHAVLVRTSPVPSSVVNRPPPVVLLTYSEAVEPRFAIVSVTDAAGKQQTAGAPRRSASDPKTLVVPLHRSSQGWYLVYWRVISVDGHPVRGAFTFAVGPNPGPAPQFPVPSISRDGRDAVARHGPRDRVPFRDGGDRAVLPAHRDRAACRAASCRDTSACGLDCLRRGSRVGFARNTGVRRDGNGGVCAAFELRSRQRLTPCARLGVRPGLFGPRADVRLVRGRGRVGALGRPLRSGAAVCRRAARDLGCAARGRRNVARPGPVGARRADVPPWSVRGPRLAAPRCRLTLDRWADRLARALVEPPRCPPRRRPDGRCSPVLECRLRLGARADRLGNRGVDRAPADLCVPLADVLRSGAPREDRTAVRRADARRSEPGPDEAETDRSQRASRSRLPARRRFCAGSSPAKRCSWRPRSSLPLSSPACHPRQKLSPLPAARSVTSAPAR